MAERFAALGVVWAMVDSYLAGLSRKLQRIVRMLRVIRFWLTVGVLAVLSSAIVGLFWPRWFPIAYAIATVFLVIPLIALAVLVGLPLRAKSAVRLIEQGYPANAKELAIRAVARKLHDESIETEELLFDTAINEGKKLMRKMRDDTPDDEPGTADGHS